MGVRVKSSPVGPLPPGIEERFLEAGGVRFRYLSSAGRTSGAGSVSPIFFLHGYAAWAEVWLPLAAALGPRRPWIALDLPDHNRSGPLPESDRSVSAYRRAVMALFDALQLPKAIVVGSSLGGTLGVMLALDRPERVERLVVLDAAGFTPTLPKKTVRLYVPFVLPSYLRAPRPRNVRRLLEKAVFRILGGSRKRGSTRSSSSGGRADSARPSSPLATRCEGPTRPSRVILSECAPRPSSSGADRIRSSIGKSGRRRRDGFPRRGSWRSRIAATSPWWRSRPRPRRPSPHSSARESSGTRSDVRTVYSGHFHGWKS